MQVHERSMASMAPAWPRRRAAGSGSSGPRVDCSRRVDRSRATQTREADEHDGRHADQHDDGGADAVGDGPSST